MGRRAERGVGAVSLHKTPLFKRIIRLARRFAGIQDELTGATGELADIAEVYIAERGLCIRCGTPLDEELRCPACFEREGAGQEEVTDDEC